MGMTSAAPSRPSPLSSDAAGPARLVSFLWRRQPELEPTGRWLTGRTDIAWPDAMVGSRAVRWMPRALLALSLVLCTLTAPALTGWSRYGLLLVLSLAAGGWYEWWTHWNVALLQRRLLAWTVQWALMAGLVWINPLGAIYAFVGYLFAGTLFTGAMQVLGVLLTALVVALSQVGGSSQLAQAGPIFPALVTVNFLIALAFVTLSNRREDAIRKRDLATRELMAAQQANLQLQQQLVDQARGAGVRDERARLARDLHDTVAQGLVAVVTQLESIDDGQLTADASRRVENAKALARQGLAEARRAVHALQPVDLDHRSLPDGLRALVRTWSEHNRIRATVYCSGEERTADVDAELIRVCQEALSNIARHAAATSVAVTLTYLEDRILMDVRDDGCGFDADSLAAPGPAGGHGLIGMSERLRLAGGDLVVESEPGSGCVLSAAMPG